MVCQRLRYSDLYEIFFACAYITCTKVWEQVQQRTVISFRSTNEFKGAYRGSSKKSDKICVARWDYAIHYTQI